MSGGTFEGGGPRRRLRRASAATIIAFAALLVVPLLPGALAAGTPAALLALPVESIAVVVLLVALPTRWLRGVVAGVFAVLVIGATVLTALNLGFEATIDRAFSLADDASSLASAFGVVSDATGTGNAVLLVALLVALVITAVVALARAALRAGRVTRASERSGRMAVVAVAGIWILGGAVGVHLVPGVPLAGADASTELAATSARTLEGFREQQQFQRAVATDALQGIPADQLLAALKGKDVVFAFLESYGRVALEGSSFSSGVARVLRAGGDQLARDGYSAQSAFLTSPTFGGVSWLAHSTLQTGVWVDSKRNYSRLLTEDRLTLTRAFHDAGWRTVSVVPSNEEPWDEGKAFYGYDSMVNSLNMGYQGPTFSYARIPDQFTWQHFYDTELAGPHAPVMAEIDFVSSHTPWTPLPHPVPWSELGDGSVFDPAAGAGHRAGRRLAGLEAGAAAVRAVGAVHARHDVLVPAHVRPAEPRARGAR